MQPCIPLETCITLLSIYDISTMYCKYCAKALYANDHTMIRCYVLQVLRVNMSIIASKVLSLTSKPNDWCYQYFYMYYLTFRQDGENQQYIFLFSL